jgi:hypothetical protein
MDESFHPRNETSISPHDAAVLALLSTIPVNKIAAKE